jgi:transposase
MLRSGGRWRDCPAAYGPPTTIYNRWNRWSGRRIWARILDALIAAGRIDEIGQLDSSHVKAHRSAGGAKGGPRHKRSASAAAGARPKSTPSAISSADRSHSP